MEKYISKRLTHEDVNSLFFIAQTHEALPAAWVHNYEISNEAIKATANQLIDKHKDNTVFCTVIENDDDIISFIWAEQNSTISNQVDIISLWTKEDVRGQGLAKKLKNELEIWAKERGASQIHTTVSKANTTMIRLNEELGYEVEYYRMYKHI
ncbi:MAG: GNAT family N-acetyltransferase [Bacillus sp. (in: Bacteria)]|nr:GNAT family N-acetyltransferase [Bacillus sp. (in: firmicutes)]